MMQNVAILFPFASIYQTARLWFDMFDMFDMFPRADGDRSRPEADQRDIGKSTKIDGG